MSVLRFPLFVRALSGIALVLLTLPIFAAEAPIPVKVVVVAMFEVGQDTGDAPGEFQYWVERDHLDHVFPMPAAYHAARMNDRGELGIVTGAGTAHGAATIMALGLDPRFDLSHAYWIIAGIAGGSPETVSLGSAAWARYVLDGDLAYEIDPREAPASWSTGYIPLGKTLPYEQPVTPRENQLFTLSSTLTQWAFNLTKNLPLADTEKLKAVRPQFDGAAAQLPPHVQLGDEVSASTFWHGKLMDAWASQWMNYFTAGKGHFATSAMEDTGSLLALRGLAAEGKVDYGRVLVLRTVSNFDQQPRGMTAAESLARERFGTYSAFQPALESAYSVGHTVADEILSHWDKYADHTPAAQPEN
jgi:purine nucleoside permease